MLVSRRLRAPGVVLVLIARADIALPQFLEGLLWLGTVSSLVDIVCMIANIGYLGYDVIAETDNPTVEEA